MTKAWYKSKTLWIAFVVFLGSIGNATGIVDLDLSPDGTVVTSAVSFIMFVLRVFTNTGVKANNKGLMMILVPLLFMSTACASYQNTIFQNEENFVDSVGVEQMADIVHLYYASCEQRENYVTNDVDVVDIAIPLFEKAFEAYRENQYLKIEIDNLSAIEVMKLSLLHENYNLGANRKYYVLACEIILIGIKTNKEFIAVGEQNFNIKKVTTSYL